MKINLRPKIEAAIKRQQELLNSLEGSDNPQTREMYHKTVGCLVGLRAVKAALDGNGISLGILAHKPKEE